MWYLDEFDSDTEEHVAQYLLEGMDGPTLKTLLHIDESEYPVEYGQHDVDLVDLPKLARFSEVPITIVSSHLYEVGLASD